MAVVTLSRPEARNALTFAMYDTKEALRRIRAGRHDDSDLIAMCFTSEDFGEGIEAFLEKRRPEWKGR